MDEELLSDADLWEAKVRAGMPKDSATAYVRNRQRTPASTKPGNEVDYSSGFAKPSGAGGGWGSTAAVQGAVDRRPLRALQNGAFPIADELRAALAGAKALVPGGESPKQAYRRVWNEEQADMGDYKREHPVASTVLEAQGGLLTGMGTVSAAAKAPTLLRTIGSGAAVAGAYGAGASGGDLTTAQGVGQRLKDALVAAGVGGGVSGGVYGVAKAAKPVVSGIVDAFPGARPKATPQQIAQSVASVRTPRQVLADQSGKVDPQVVGEAVRRAVAAPRRALIQDTDQRGNELVLRSLDRAGMTVDDLAAKAQTALPNETPMELIGQPAVRAARGAHAIPSKGSAQMEDFLQNRMAGQEERILGSLVEKTGTGGRVDIRRTLDELDTEMRFEASQLYGAIRDVPVADPNVYTALRRPAFQRAYEKARAIRENEATAALMEGAEGMDAPALLPTLDELLSGRADLTLGTLDQIKRGLDDVIYSAKREGLGKSEVGSLEGVRHAFVRLLDKAVPEYASARSAYAGKAALSEALEQGRALFSLPREEAEALLSRMGESEQTMFRKGAMEALAEKIEGVNLTHDATVRKPLANNTLDRKKLRLIFPDDAAFNDFVETIQREGAMAGSGRTVLGGSPTSRIDAEKEDLALDMLRGATGAPGGLLNRLGGLLVDKAADVGLTRGLEARADALAPKLTATGDDLQKLVEALRQAQERIARTQRTQEGGRRGVAAFLGQQDY